MKSPEQTSYFVRFRGRVSGPFGLERLRSMAYAGQISPIHEVSPDRTTWTQASDVPGLLPAAPEPAPAHQQSTASSETNPPQDRWYYLNADGKRTGPIARQQLLDLKSQGQIGDETAVWTKGMAKWLPFEDAGLIRSRGRANVRVVEQDEYEDPQLVQKWWSFARRPSERFLVTLAWSCYASVWATFGLNCLAILMPAGLAVVCAIFSILLTIGGLLISLYTFTNSVKLWPNRDSGVPVAGVVCSTITTIYFTTSLMCSCIGATILIKGIDIMNNFPKRGGF